MGTFKAGMTRSEFIAFLKALPGRNPIVVLSTDEEGNGFSDASNMFTQCKINGKDAVILYPAGNYVDIDDESPHPLP